MHKMNPALLLITTILLAFSTFANENIEAYPDRVEKFGCSGLINSYDAQDHNFVLSCQAEHVPDFQTKTVHINKNTRLDNIQKSDLDGASVKVEGVVIDGQNIAKIIQFATE